LQRGVHPEIVKELTPTKVSQKPRQVVSALRLNARVRGLFDARQETAVVNRLKRERKKARELLVGPGASGTLGGLRSFVEKHLRVRTSAEFDENTPFVFGSWLVEELSSDACSVRICLSTENLLLNAYRQAVSGLPPLLCVDTTHRLVHEGYPVFPMGTVDIGQRFHIIAYMIATNEGKQDWDTAIADVKAEVTAVDGQALRGARARLLLPFLPLPFLAVRPEGESSKSRAPPSLDFAMRPTCEPVAPFLHEMRASDALCVRAGSSFGGILSKVPC
jgi:hypothetical protein